jgi:hypothetical protein
MLIAKANAARWNSVSAESAGFVSHRSKVSITGAAAPISNPSVKKNSANRRTPNLLYEGCQTKMHRNTHAMLGSIAFK